MGTLSTSALGRSLSWALLTLALLAVGGCASGPTANPQDPLEPMNRHISKFNEDVDGLVLKPVATGYRNSVPPLVRTGVSNFFNNISDIGSFFNNVLQLKPQASVDMFVRVGINTFVGIGGLFNVASDLNIERHPEDFGQTMGRWGVPAGPYLVLPVLGPSTIRDATALVVDTGYVDPVGTRSALGVLRVVNTRSNLLSLGDMLDEAALDKYSFTRDAYLQRRRSLIADGEESDTPEDTPKEPAKETPRGAPDKASAE